ncbi:hypothetical protein N7492_010683 [Penicillium capsulatum]|uniref:Peptidase M20 dimerisation domain-containing protein n=1 Tax=Penicillium capsulatum TaxID=69766 RepID=A0A9W9HLQ9_9EURO|nr:hypothetical protein N7492_010683 [Penicillium capsulatum]KAJ6113181.1 hypothetical protein N7512_008505 [Penicillium capsulatum]
MAAQSGLHNLMSDFQGEAGPGPRVVLNGHIDVIPVPENMDHWTRDPWSGDVENGRIHGRGVDKARWGGDVMLSTEPSGSTVQKGTLRLSGTVTTTGALGAYLNLSQGAIQTANSFLSEVVETVESIEPTPPPKIGRHMKNPETLVAVDEAMGPESSTVIAKPTVNIGTIQDGLEVNMIPEQCIFEIDIRLPIGLDANAVMAVIEPVIPNYPDARIELRKQEAHLMENVALVCGSRPAIIPSMDATDCKYYRYARRYVFGGHRLQPAKDCLISLPNRAATPNSIVMVVPYLPQHEEAEHLHLEPAIPPFAGRLGGNQDFIVDRHDPKNVEVLERVPDAAPCMTLAEIFDLRAFVLPPADAHVARYLVANSGEVVASFINVFISCWVTTHPLSKTTSPTTEAGVYATVTFFSPLFGGITNLLLTPLLIYTFSPSSGGHISPTITLATFFARIISFPRMVLYLAGQTLGGAFAGLAMHSAYGSRQFTVGGCHIDTSMVDANSGLVIEFVACLALIFLAFGTALDPRQANVFGHATSPWFVGIALAIVSWGTAFTREGYIGASLNPARCLGAYVASEFPSYHWIHWIGPLVASVGHGLVYFVDPLWTETRHSA